MGRSRLCAAREKRPPSAVLLVLLCAGFAPVACQGPPPPGPDPGPDLSAAEDLSAGEEDLQKAPDLRSPADLSSPADLRPQADLSSPPDLVAGCAGDMADLSSDPRNCGRCGNVCPAGHNCCNGVCSDPGSDPGHCGTCAHSCGGNACCAGLCTSLTTPTNCGACGVTCPAGQGCCSGACSDRQTDPNHCGTCGNACAPGSVCLRGACYAADGGLPDMSGGGCLSDGKSPPAACFLGSDPMSGSRYTICRADCMSAWVHHADAGGGRYAFQTICKNLGYSRAAQWGGTCGDICGFCEGKMTSCMRPGSEKYDSNGMCGADCLEVTVMWQCVK